MLASCGRVPLDGSKPHTGTAITTSAPGWCEDSSAGGGGGGSYTGVGNASSCLARMQLRYSRRVSTRVVRRLTRSAERPLGPSRTREDTAGGGAGWGLGEMGGGVARAEAGLEGAGATEGATGALVVLVVAEEGWGCRLELEGEEGGGCGRV